MENLRFTFHNKEPSSANERERVKKPALLAVLAFVDVLFCIQMHLLMHLYNFPVVKNMV